MTEKRHENTCPYLAFAAKAPTSGFPMRTKAPSWAVLGSLLVLVAASAACNDAIAESCAADGDCAQGERCNAALDVPACQPIHTGAEWTPCSSDDLCESERCLVRSSQVCVEPGWQRGGEACEHDDDCMSDLVCHVDGTCTSPAVAQRKREG